VKVKIIGYSLLAIVVILALDYGSILWTGVTAPKREEIRREVFENTRSFNEGKLQQIGKYKYEYDTGTEGEKAAVKSVVRNTFTDYDIEDLPTELQYFVQDCRGY
jgi:hypothetical protein